jgi:hypothetical protein
MYNQANLRIVFGDLLVSNSIWYVWFLFRLVHEAFEVNDVPLNGGNNARIAPDQVWLDTLPVKRIRYGIVQIMFLLLFQFRRIHRERLWEVVTSEPLAPTDEELRLLPSRERRTTLLHVAKRTVYARRYNRDGTEPTAVTSPANL